MVAQVDEQQAAMVAHAMHPAREADIGADIRLTEGGAGVAAVTVHGLLSGDLVWDGPAIRHTAEATRKIARTSACRVRFVKNAGDARGWKGFRWARQ